MKILLIDTPSLLKDAMDPPRVFLPLGLLYIAAVLEPRGYQVKVYDPKLSAKLTKCRGHFYLGDLPQRIKEVIASFAPDIVGISALFSRDAENALMIAGLAKEVSPKIKVILGGAYPSSAPEECIQNPGVDYLILGEGEEVILRMLKLIEEGEPLRALPGCAYKEQGKIQIREQREYIKNIDSLPQPAYHLVDMERYFRLQSRGFAARPLGGNRAVSMITSRGCPYTCIFCSIHQTMGLKWRGHSSEYVLSHIERVVRQYQARSIQFEDDNLINDRARFELILEGILRKAFKINWGTPNGVRADTIVDQGLLSKMKKAGCRYINIGVESGSPRVLREIIRKNLSLSAVEKVSSLCKKLRIPLSAYYLVGLPGERPEDIQATLDLALGLDKKYQVYPYVNYAIPFPGTPLYALCKEKGYLTSEVNSRSLLQAAHFRGDGLIKTEAFTPLVLKEKLEHFYKAFVRNHIRKACVSPCALFQDIRLVLRNSRIFRRVALGR